MARNFNDVNIYTLEDWWEKGRQLFGKDMLKWEFKCPACGEVASIDRFMKEAGLTRTEAEDAVLFKCIHNYFMDSKCQYKIGSNLLYGTKAKTRLNYGNGHIKAVFDFNEKGSKK